MLFKLKSVLYPPDATVINRRRYKITRFFLAVASEHCITTVSFLRRHITLLQENDDRISFSLRL